MTQLTSTLAADNCTYWFNYFNEMDVLDSLAVGVDRVILC